MSKGDLELYTLGEGRKAKHSADNGRAQDLPATGQQRPAKETEAAADDAKRPLAKVLPEPKLAASAKASPDPLLAFLEKGVEMLKKAGRTYDSPSATPPDVAASARAPKSTGVVADIGKELNEGR